MTPSLSQKSRLHISRNMEAPIFEKKADSYHHGRLYQQSNQSKLEKDSMFYYVKSSTTFFACVEYMATIRLIKVWKRDLVMVFTSNLYRRSECSLQSCTPGLYRIVSVAEECKMPFSDVYRDIEPILYC